MRSLVSLVAVLFLAVDSVVGQAGTPPTINTPLNVIQCQVTQFQFQGGVQPYNLFFTAGNTSGGAVVKQFDNLNGTTFAWKATLPANTQFIANLRDSVGAIGQSGAITVLSGADRTCENSQVVETGTAGGGPAPTGGSTPPPSPPAGTTTSAGSTTPTTSRSTTSSSSTAPAGTSNAAASHLTVGLTGVFGLIGALVL